MNINKMPENNSRQCMAEPCTHLASHWIPLNGIDLNLCLEHLEELQQLKMPPEEKYRLIPVGVGNPTCGHSGWNNQLANCFSLQQVGGFSSYPVYWVCETCAKACKRVLEGV